MKTAWLVAVSLTVMWFFALASMAQAFSFSFTETLACATADTSSGVISDKNKMDGGNQATNDAFQPEPAGYDSGEFDDEQKHLLANPLNPDLAGGVNDQDWLLLNSLSPVSGSEAYRMLDKDLVFPY
jgi:hypothetical protein